MPGKSSVPSRNRATATSSAAMSAAVAREPIRPASRAIRRAGKRSSSGARKSSRPAATRSGGATGDGRRSRVRDRVLDRQAHVGGAQLGLERAVAEADGRVDDRLGVDDDLDPVVGHAVEPVRLDDLEALVGEGRRVDRDLGAHRPGRVAQGQLGRDAGERRDRQCRGTGRPTRSAGVPRRRRCPRRRGTARSPNARSRSGGASRAASPAGRAGRPPLVRRPWRRASAITRWPPATSVSLFAVATTLPARSAARTGRRLTTPPVPTTTRSDVVARRELDERIRAADARSPGREVEGATPSGPASATARGRRRRACSSSRCGLRCRSRARRPASPGRAASRTSTAWVPIDPPDPSRATPTGRASRGGPRDRQPCATTIQVTRTGRREEDRVDPVEDPAVARDERARVLRAGGALEERFGEVAGLGRRTRGAGRGRAASSGFDCRPARGRPRRPRVATTRPPSTPSSRLLGRDPGEERAPPDRAPDEVGARVEAPDAGQQDDDPASLRPEGRSRSRRIGPRGREDRDRADESRRRPPRRRSPTRRRTRRPDRAGRRRATPAPTATTPTRATPSTAATRGREVDGRRRARPSRSLPRIAGHRRDGDEDGRPRGDPAADDRTSGEAAAAARPRARRAPPERRTRIPMPTPPAAIASTTTGTMTQGAEGPLAHEIAS